MLKIGLSIDTIQESLELDLQTIELIRNTKDLEGNDLDKLISDLINPLYGSNAQ
jgi:hypothetical protein